MQAVGKRVEELFSEDFADTLRQVLGNDRLAPQGNSQHLQDSHGHLAPAAHWCSTLRIAPLQDWQEQTGALVVLEDVTSRIQSRRAIATT